jgi:hypothetical protein
MSVVTFADVEAARAAGYRTVGDMRAAGYVVRDSSGPGEFGYEYTATDATGGELVTVDVWTNERNKAGGLGAVRVMFPPAEVADDNG